MTCRAPTGPEPKACSPGPVGCAAIRAARRFHPDVVYAHFLFPTGLSGVLAAGAARSPLVVTAHGQDVAFETAANQHHNARVRQAVLKVARSASLEDLNDPNLTTIKRQLREEINKVLRKSYVTEVVISDFKTMEQ